MTITLAYDNTGTAAWSPAAPEDDLPYMERVAHAAQETSPPVASHPSPEDLLSDAVVTAGGAEYAASAIQHFLAHHGVELIHKSMEQNPSATLRILVGAINQNALSYAFSQQADHWNKGQRTDALGIPIE